MHPFATEAARARLQAAADRVERESSVEVVITVRPASVDLRSIELLGGAACALAVLLFTLFAPPTFSLIAIAIATVVAFGAGAAAMAAAPGLRRNFASQARLRDGVRQAARACFVELGVHGTRDRTGILVYISLAEERVALVADLGVHAAMAQGLAILAEPIEAVGRTDGFDAAAVEQLAAAIEGLGAGVRHNLRRAEDDLDELGEWQ